MSDRPANKRRRHFRKSQRGSGKIIYMYFGHYQLKNRSYGVYFAGYVGIIIFIVTATYLMFRELYDPKIDIKKEILRLIVGNVDCL